MQSTGTTGKNKRTRLYANKVKPKKSTVVIPFSSSSSSSLSRSLLDSYPPKKKLPCDPSVSPLQLLPLFLSKNPAPTVSPPSQPFLSFFSSFFSLQSVPTFSGKPSPASLFQPSAPWLPSSAAWRLLQLVPRMERGPPHISRVLPAPLIYIKKLNTPWLFKGGLHKGKDNSYILEG